jgi:hypothetical protein
VRVPVVFAAASLILVAASATACSSGAEPAGTTTSPASTAASQPTTGAQATAASQPTTGAGGAASTVDVCSMISAARASAIVGVTYSSATGSLGGEVCTYATTDAPIPLSISVQPGPGTTGWTEELGIIQEGGGSAPVTLTGVGDRAAGGGNEVGVQDGSHIIDILGGDPVAASNAYPKSVELAKAIIAVLH